MNNRDFVLIDFVFLSYTDYFLFRNVLYVKYPIPNIPTVQWPINKPIFHKGNDNCFYYYYIKCFYYNVMFINTIVSKVNDLWYL